MRWRALVGAAAAARTWRKADLRKSKDWKQPLPSLRRGWASNQKRSELRFYDLISREPLSSQEAPCYILLSGSLHSVENGTTPHPRQSSDQARRSGGRGQRSCPLGGV